VAQSFQVTGVAGVPSGATAVTGNLTVTQQNEIGFLYVGPDRYDNPTSSTLNFPKADDRANAVAVKLGSDGKLWVTYAAPTMPPLSHVIFDVTGYFVNAAPTPTPTPTPTATPLVCLPATPLPASPFGGTIPVLFQDNFEATTFGASWVVDHEGDGTATIAGDKFKTGACAGRLSVTTSDTSRAYLTRDLGGNKTDLWASGWFNVVQQGVAGSNVPYIRFFDGATRVAEVMRSNDDGDAWIGTFNGTTRSWTTLNTPIGLNSWHQVTLHVHPNTTTSTIEVWIDGTLVSPALTTYNLGTTTKFTLVQLGSEFQSQAMLQYFDDIVLGGS
jgi:hypothetical protein